MLTYRQYGEKERNIMAINYDAYLGFETKRFTTKYFVDSKILVLQELGHLQVNDPIEESLREILMACKTDRAMTSCLRDVIFNDKPIAKLVAEKGGACK